MRVQVCVCMCVRARLCRAEGGLRVAVSGQGRAVTVGGEPWALGLTDAVLVSLRPAPLPRLEQQKGRKRQE